jgi:hypothetical protein
LRFHIPFCFQYNRKQNRTSVTVSEKLMSPEKNRGNEQDKKAMMNLSAWLGRHQAFGLIANHCSATDAECLKATRDGGECKQLGLTWERSRVKHAGVSRAHADRQIHYLEEFGGNYFRFAEVMPISPETYRLIAGAISDVGLECNGERIPLARENRDKVAAAVTAMRAKVETRKAGSTVIGGLRKRLDALLAEAHGVASRADRRLELIGLLEEGGESLQGLAHVLREKTLALK